MPDLNGNGIDDVDEVNEALTTRGLNFLAWLWRGLWRALYGIKALVSAVFFGIIGLADQFGAMDMLQQWRYQVEDERLGKYIIAAIIFLTVSGYFMKAEKKDEGDTDEPA